MFSTPILDVAIGLSLFYLLLGLICTTVNEMIAGWRNTRAKFLELGIERLLGGDPDLKKAFFEHPLISSLADDNQARPSYIPAERFAKALLDILSGDNKLTDVAAVRAGLAKIGNPALQRSLTALIDTVKDDSAALSKEMQRWFDHNMDRVSGWYKRNAQRNTLILASVVTLVVNADTVWVARTLWTNPAVRAALVEQAQTRGAMARPEELPAVNYDNAEDATASTPVAAASSAEGLSSDELKLLGDLTGWDTDWKTLGKAKGLPSQAEAALGILGNHIVGWLITALAVSLGAPFWFDTLGRFINLRNAGKPPADSRGQPAPAAGQPSPNKETSTP